MAVLSAGVPGTHSAAEVAHNLRKSFREVKIALVVGIAGGVPSRKNDVRLGDVVVANEVVHYERQAVHSDGRVVRKGDTLRPPDILLRAVNRLEAKHGGSKSRIPTILLERQDRMPAHVRPEMEDKLFHSKYRHCALDDSMDSYKPDEPLDPCNECEDDKIIGRRVRPSLDPRIHIGKIASGNTLLRSSPMRESMGREELEVLCFEMEALGLMKILPCLPIRGISDYADSHKNDGWQSYAAAVAAAYAREFLDELQPEPIPNVSRNDFDEESEFQEKRKSGLMGALDFPERDQRRAGIDDNIDGTCHWLLELPDYLRWLDDFFLAEHRGLLWLKGHPGTGKSTLMRLAFENHKKRQQAQEDRPPKMERLPNVLLISFFFHARGAELEHSVKGMYRSFLVEILEAFPDLQTVFLDESLAPAGVKDQLELPTLQRLFKAAISRLDHRKVICYIDALDECDSEEIEAMMVPFQDIARSDLGQRGQLRAFCSSRYYRNLDPEVGIILKLEQIADHMTDLKVYIHKRLRNDLKTESGLEKLLLVSSQGVFLWAVLVVSMLNKAASKGRKPKSLKQLRRMLPEGLDDAFSQIIVRDLFDSEVDEADRLEFSIAATWILHAKYPLGLKQFYHALEAGLAVEISDHEILAPGDPMPSSAMIQKRVTSATKGLAEVKGEWVQFIHESVRAFLMKEKMTLPTHNKDSRSLRSTLPLAYYAQDYILEHAEIASLSIQQGDFIRNFPETTFMALKKQSRRPPIGNSLHDCVSKTLFKLLDCGAFEQKTSAAAHLNGQDDNDETPLFIATEAGHLAVVQKLVFWGADLNIPDTSGKTPVMCAISRKRVQIAEFLIELGADLTCHDRQMFTALHFCAEVGTTSVLQRLIKCGAKLEARVSYGSTPLMLTIERGYEEAAKILLDAGASIDAVDSERRTALILAPRRCSHHFQQVLLDQGANIHHADCMGNTAFMAAANHGTEASVRLLVDSGADINCENSHGKTALDMAWDRESNGVDWSICDKFDAAEQKSESKRIVSYLLSKGAKPGSWRALYISEMGH